MAGLNANLGMLCGWRAIAAYLGKSEKTARRWKSRYRLPVYTLPSRQVFALAPELVRFLLVYDSLLKSAEPPPDFIRKRREHAAWIRSRKGRSTLSE